MFAAALRLMSRSRRSSRNSVNFIVKRLARARKLGDSIAHVWYVLAS